MKIEGKWDEGRKLIAEIQKRIRKDKEKYIQAELNKKGRTRELYQQIRKIT
jgi:hypothetical protein